MEVRVVPLLPTHLAEIAVLERICFSEPWSEGSLSLLTKEPNFGVVVLCGDQVVAYGGMTSVLDEGSITNIATHPDHRRQGLGRLIVKVLLAEAKQRGLATVFLEVRESNQPARALYVAEGFSEVGLRKNFYRQPMEHAVQMMWTNHG